jgi:fimbrial chaperone protein
VRNLANARCRLAAGVVSVLILLAAPAVAANFSVDPTSLTFAKDARADVVSGDIVVRNVGDETLRMSIHAYDWTQTRDEREHLVETGHVAYYPQQFTIDPGRSQRIRIGVTDKRTSAERAYRLILTELPKPRFATNAAVAGLSFYTKVDIPIFLEPVNREAPALKIGQVNQSHRDLTLVLSNDGMTHAAPSTVSVTIRNRSGRTVYHEDVSAFYLLAQREQAIHIQMPRTVCPTLGDVVVQWSGTSLYATQVVPLRGDECAR